MHVLQLTVKEMISEKQIQKYTQLVWNIYAEGYKLMKGLRLHGDRVVFHVLEMSNL